MNSRAFRSSRSAPPISPAAVMDADEAATWAQSGDDDAQDLAAETSPEAPGGSSSATLALRRRGASQASRSPVAAPTPSASSAPHSEAESTASIAEDPMSLWLFPGLVSHQKRETISTALGDELDPHPAGWERHACPHCFDEQNPLDTVLWQPSTGHFFCLNCGYKGDVSVNPSAFSSKTLGLSWEFWKGTLVTPDRAQKTKGIPSFPVAFWAEHPAYITALPWPNSHGVYKWREAWVWPIFDKKEAELVLVDVIGIVHNEDGHWEAWRVPTKSPYPAGWANIQEEAVFVNHPLDYYALVSAGITEAVCLPPGMNPRAPSSDPWKAMLVLEKKLDTIKKMTFAFAAVDSSHFLEEELARRLGQDRCWRARWTDLRSKIPSFMVLSARTAWDYVNGVGIRRVIEEASAMPVEGVYEVIDVNEEIDHIHTHGMPSGDLVNWPSLDDLWTAAPGEITLLAGTPQHGKTTLINNIAINLSYYSGWSFGIFSPETRPVARYYAKLIETLIGNSLQKLNQEELNAAKAYIQNHFKIILPRDDSKAWRLDALLELARTLVVRYGIRGLVIDPWNEVEHNRDKHQTLAEYLADALSKVRRFASQYGVHVFIINHPNKLEKQQDGHYPVVTPYMLDGGAMWYNKPDNIISAYRHVGKPDQDVLDLHVQKVRNEEIGSRGRVSLRYDIARRRYIDDINQDGRREALNRSTGSGPSSRKKVEDYTPSALIRLPKPRQDRPYGLEAANPKRGKKKD